MVFGLMAGVQTKELLDRLRLGRERADASGRPVLISVAQPGPQDRTAFSIFGARGVQNTYRSFWARPSGDFWLVGIGTATAISVNGERPIDEARRAHRSLFESAVISDPGIRGVGPLFFGGFRFDPQAPRSDLWKDFPGGLLVLPKFLFTFSAGSSWLTINVIMKPGADPEEEAEAALAELGHWLNGAHVPSEAHPALQVFQTPSNEWEQWVRQSLQAIENGQLTKVVLARKMTLQAEKEFSTEAALSCLSSAYPDCSVFAMDNGASTFVGASPESIVHLDKGILSLSCLAGSIARGATSEQDQQFAVQLLASAKDRREHDAVVAMIAETLSRACNDIHWDATPQVVKLRTVQHLATFFRGHPKEPHDILALVELLHPTPAVAGVPTPKAMETIRRLEGDRGWYAAPVGWLDNHGEGEFDVAIRSAVVCGKQATLFAGSGIVQGSEPDLEFKETELKFQPMLAALRGF
ncbi:MAG: isochorismate synthase [Dehalococcoidia bacterium]|nr:isochorismate synthase [Dehalococcoidia bacterium]